MRGHPDRLFLSQFCFLSAVTTNLEVSQCAEASAHFRFQLLQFVWMQIYSLDSDKGVQSSPQLNSLRPLWARGEAPILFHRGPIIRKYPLFFT